jgi:hypothetical protein
VTEYDEACRPISLDDGGRDSVRKVGFLSYTYATVAQANNKYKLFLIIRTPSLSVQKNMVVKETTVLGMTLKADTRNMAPYSSPPPHILLTRSNLPYKCA